jgi:hypothetical protein
MGLTDKVGEPARPPMYEILLATGDRIEHHVALNLTPTGTLDRKHTDPARRAEILAEHPDIAEPVRDRPELVEKPWLLNGGLMFGLR